MAFRLVSRIAAAAMICLAAVPAPAQLMSPSYTFLKAVKDRDGDKVTQMIAEPGSVVIHTKDRDTGEGALHLLTRERDITWITFMLAKGARPDMQNKDGMTPLALAAQIGWVEGAERLLRGRAKVDLPNNLGETPLILAIHNRDIAMARLLLSAGADANRTDNVAGHSALYYAKQDARSAALAKLLETPPSPTRQVAGPPR